MFNIPSYQANANKNVSEILPHTWELLNLKKEENPICDDMDEPGGVMLSIINKTEKTSTLWYHFYVRCRKKNQTQKQ